MYRGKLSGKFFPRALKNVHSHANRLHSLQRVKDIYSEDRFAQDIEIKF